MLGGVDFSDLFITPKEGTTAGPYAMLTSAQLAGTVTIGYALFVNAGINVLIVAFAVFLLINGINKLQREKEAPATEPITKECPRCYSVIAIKATCCPRCTSELG